MVNRKNSQGADTATDNGEPVEVEQQTQSADQPATPVPAGITATWFPALVVLPGERLQLPGKHRVYATPEGLYIYSKVPAEQAQNVQATPDWYAPIAYDETDVPPPNYSARAANGFVIHTERGPVSITVPKGCTSCGVRAIAAWEPVWARTQLTGQWKE
jgi:hypothetical protein